VDKAITLFRHTHGADTDFERAGYLDTRTPLVGHPVRAEGVMG
jgi:hypothetical protein